MITDQNHDPHTLQARSLPIEHTKNLSAETLKNIHDDLHEIRAALDCLHDDGVRQG
jgi:hypothetical protein